MKDDGAANWFIRLLAMAFLVSFAAFPCLVAFWIIKAMLRDPGHATLDQYGYLSACVLVIGLFVHAIWRVYTWSSSRADGTLVPPLIVYALLVPLCAMWSYGVYLGVVAGKWVQVVSLLTAVVAGVALMRE